LGSGEGTAQVDSIEKLEGRAKTRPAAGEPPQRLLASLERARNWAIEEALPFWGARGFDPWLGGFHERTDLSGKPLSLSPRRTMSQARQIYVFAHAELLGWHPAAGALATKAADSLIRRHWRADGKDGWIFAITPDGGVADARRDTYAHAFAAYGLAWAYRVRPSRLYRDIADETFHLLDTLLAAPDLGGVLDGVPRPDNWRRQNPHMHLFEACLAWYEATGEARYLGRAGEIFGLFSTRFLQPGSGILAEYYDDRWMPVEGERGRVSEPGHHFEWVWLLRKFARATGRDVSAHVDKLFGHSLAYGQGPLATLVEEVLDDGTVVKSSCRTWPYTEAVKAAVAEHEAGRPGMEPLIANWLDTMFRRHLSGAFPGGWIDQVSADGKPMVDFAPASTLYHAFLAIAEVERVFGSGGRRAVTPPPMG
jgi:mannose/cellobiose epimerase-like protein (N-acyl-D-glucosamine 2-epimerase family)